MYRKISGLVFIFTLLLSGVLFAQRRIIDKQEENLKYKLLQQTGKGWDKSIQEVFSQLAQFGFLVELAKNDRATAILAEKEPYNFRYDKRHLKFVPWRSNIRYVKEGDSLLLNSFGKISEVKELINKKIQLATAQNNVKVANPSIGNRDGVEISQFGFVYAKGPDKTRVIGTQRKWISLYFAQPARAELSLATIRIEYHDFREGVKEVELIIDPSPTDKQMEDIVIIHRYNQTVPEVYLLALMSNDKSFAHRNQFKKKYHGYLRSHFLQSLRRMAAYNTLTTHGAHEKEVKRLERGLEY